MSAPVDVQRTLPSVPPTRRPRRSDPTILRRAAELLAPAFIAWINEPTLVDEAINDLAETLRSHPNADGYVLARHFEDRHLYSPDSDLVNVLDGAFSQVCKALEEASEAWVEAEGIVLDFVVGQAVTTRHGDGVVAFLRPKTAQYVVAVTPDQQARPGSGYVLNAEDVTAAPTLVNGVA